LSILERDSWIEKYFTNILGGDISLERGTKNFLLISFMISLCVERHKKLIEIKVCSLSALQSNLL